MDLPPTPSGPAGFVRTPVAVVIDDQEWTARSLDSVLGTAGYAVLKAYTGRQAMDLLGRVRPDAVFIDLQLPDVEGMTLYGQLRDAGMIDPGVPVIGLSPGRIDRPTRLDALSRGAWDVLGLPLDADELVLRLGAMVRAKQATDRIREESLVDPDTGLYNMRGLLHRLAELRSEAARTGRSLACIVVGPRDESEYDRIRLEAALGGDPAAAPRIRFDAPVGAVELWEATRRCDAKGSIGRTVYVVVAPDTDEAGALHLAQRILEVTADESSGERVAGLFAEGDVHHSPVSAADFLSRATEAFRRAQIEGGSGRILPYGSDTN